MCGFIFRPHRPGFGNMIGMRGFILRPHRPGFGNMIGMRGFILRPHRPGFGNMIGIFKINDARITRRESDYIPIERKSQIIDHLQSLFKLSINLPRKNSHEDHHPVEVRMY